MKVNALFETTLTTKISKTATSMDVASAENEDGDALSGTFGFIIDEGNSNQEFVSGTISGTTVSSMSRGLSTADGETEVSDLKYSHRRGASVKITNFPLLGILMGYVNDSSPLPSPLRYDSGVSPSHSQDLTDKSYVDNRDGYWDGAVADFDALLIGDVEGEARVTLDEGKIYVWDIASSTTATIDSVDTGTDVITFTGNHGLETGDYCYFIAGSSDLPAGLSEDTGYYVYKDSATELHVSASKAGSTVDITDSGSGTNTMKEAEWVLAGAGGGTGTVYVTNKLGTGAEGGDNRTFELDSGSFTSDVYLQVYLNGVLMENGASEDYQTSGGNQAIFNYDVEDTDKITLLVVSVDLYNPAWGTVTADILPDTTNTHDIGSDSKRFKDGYFEGDVDVDGNVDVEGTLDVGGAFESVGIATLADESVTKTTAAPTADAQIANKKYVDDEKSTNWDYISTDAISGSEAASGGASDTSTIPAGTNFIICSLRTRYEEGGTHDDTKGQIILMPGVLDSQSVQFEDASDDSYLGFSASISGSTLTLSTIGVAGGGGKTAWITGNVYYYK